MMAEDCFKQKKMMAEDGTYVDNITLHRIRLDLGW
jgi:hypothetical protein